MNMSLPNPEQQPEREDPREGLWDPERDAAAQHARRRPAPTPSGPRKRALPKSWVSKSLWILIALVIMAAILGLF